MRIFAPLNSEPEPILQQIEVATFLQLPSFQIVGLPSPEVAEARERVRSAIEASGMEFPRRRVVLNLSPAHIRKKGTGLDLPMALSIILLDNPEPTALGAWGELGLDGSVKPAGQMTRTLYAAWKGGLSALIISHEEYRAALAAVRWIEQSHELEGSAPALIPVSHLVEAKKLISGLISGSKPGRSRRPARGKRNLPYLEDSFSEPTPPVSLLPLGEGLERVIGTAVAGCHHLLLLGPRGTGKTQALEWVVALQPKASAQDRLKQRLLSELTRSPQGSEASSLLDQAPIRRVGSQVRPGALIGGATSFTVRPGEFSLAHGGVLLADELPEWPRDSRESLREPLERGRVTLTRAQGALELPSQFVLAANGNLCPCGGWPKNLPLPSSGAPAGSGVSWSRCKCTDSARDAYLSKLSGPLLDRIDITLLLAHPAVPQTSSQNPPNSCTPLAKLKEKVETVRTQLKERWGAVPGFLYGAQLELILHRHSEIQRHLSRLPYVSLRSRHKLLRLALSLSAWDGKEMPDETHFIEAGYYRPERYLFVN